MKNIFKVILFCYVFLVVFVLVNYGDASESNSAQARVRRYLSFRNISHFFLRFNFKANMVPWNQIFAQALGFRMNWDDPPDSFHPYHHLNRRTVYNHLETLLDRNGLSGFHCVRRAVCETNAMDRPRGVYHKIMKIIFRKMSSMTDKWHNVTSEDCVQSISTCPFSMLEVSLYTDL